MTVNGQWIEQLGERMGSAMMVMPRDEAEMCVVTPAAGSRLILLSKWTQLIYTSSIK